MTPLPAVPRIARGLTMAQIRQATHDGIIRVPDYHRNAASLAQWILFTAWDGAAALQQAHNEAEDRLANPLRHPDPNPSPDPRYIELQRVERQTFCLAGVVSYDGPEGLPEAEALHKLHQSLRATANTPKTGLQAEIARLAAIALDLVKRLEAALPPTGPDGTGNPAWYYRSRCMKELPG